MSRFDSIFSSPVQMYRDIVLLQRSRGLGGGGRGGAAALASTTELALAKCISGSFYVMGNVLSEELPCTWTVLDIFGTSSINSV